ncbi:MAG: hypothetical protein J6Z38_01005 [Lachnospiraceae bacterium]|nr:hypothetical protein [Lachnospiraceae bacterium]
MRRKAVALLLAVLFALASASCKSTLGPALEREEGRKNIRELPYEELADEASGFRYPGLPWGITLDEVQERTYDAVTKVSGVDTKGNIVYTAPYLKALAGGRQNDDTQISTDPDTRLISLMLVFSAQNAEDTLGQSAVFDLLHEKLTAAYGTPAIDKHTDEMTGGLTADIEDHTWVKTYGEGLESRLVLSKGFVSYSSEPDYISLTFLGDGAHE